MGKRQGRVLGRKRQRLMESLESRDLLACDVVAAGDANRDCYFDEADFVQAMASGKFETGEAADWTEGDWSGDGLFDSGDFVSAFVTANYRMGAYGETNEAAVTTLAPMASSGDADVTVYYLPDSGDVIAVADGYVTAIHLRSQSEAFEAVRQDQPPFDVNTSADLFLIAPEGYQVIQFLSALPAGMTNAEVQADLLVAGATYGGGDLGNVQLGDAAELPEGLPYEGVPPGGTGVSNEFGGEPPVVDPPVFEPPAVGTGIGDANRDGHVDQSDLIQAMKSGAFNADVAADWANGDWTGDDLFTPLDFVELFKTGFYANGAYNADAGEAVNQLVAVAEPTESADVTLHYDPATGDLVVASHAGLLTSVHLSSAGSTFLSISDQVSPTPFDLYTESDVFFLATEGVSAVRIHGILPSNLTPTQALAGLAADGSMKAGGGLGVVAIGDETQFPTGEVTTINREPYSESFVDAAVANAMFTYDSETGDVTISAVDTPVAVFELISDTNDFVGADVHDYGVGVFDVSRTDKLFRLEPDGMVTVELPGLLVPGLTSEQIRQSGIVVAGALVDGERLQLAVTVPAVPANAIGCENAAVIGDVNGDGKFDSSDLVAVFSAGQFEDDVIGNAGWADGDWNCDGDFDSSDLVLAMQSGFDGEPANAAAATDLVLAAAAVEHETKRNDGFGSHE